MYVETTLLEAFIGFFFLSKRKNCEWCGKRFPKGYPVYKDYLGFDFHRARVCRKCYEELNPKQPDPGEAGW